MKIFSENDGNSLNSLLCIERTLDNLLDNGPRYYILKLPTFPKSFEELAITRYCLQQLLNCVFEYALFDEIVFNPELINLLFNDNKIICPKFYIENPNLFPSKLVSFYNIWEFVSNHLTISEILYLHFTSIFGVDFDNLLNILTNEGSKLPIVSFQFSGNDLNFLIHLCNLIIKVSYPGHTFSSWPIYISFVDPLQYESIYTGCLVELNRLAPKSI